jgi:hypothetical protein
MCTTEINRLLVEMTNVDDCQQQSNRERDRIREGEIERERERERHEACKYQQLPKH